MLNMNESTFKNELKKYSLKELSNIKSCFEGCVSVLSGLGAEKPAHEAHTTYVDMVNKVSWTQAESVVRENECNVISQICGTQAVNNSSANPFGLLNIKVDIQKYMDLETYVGAVLWSELNAFRREEAYSDSNFISDGLENGELIRRSYELLQSAEQKMAENNSHSYEISATLKNLLLIPEFAPLKDYLECGNWLRIKTDDGRLYKLRLTSYEFDFNNPTTLSVTFSDITDTSNIRTMQSLIRKVDYITKATAQMNVTSKFEYLNETITANSSSTLSSINDLYGSVNDVSNSVNTSVVALEGQIAMKVSQGAISSSLSVESGSITLNSNRLIINSSGFSLNGSGYMWCNSASIYSAYIEYGTIEDVVINRAEIHYGSIENASIDDDTINRAKINNGKISNATIEECSLKNCSISGTLNATGNVELGSALVYDVSNNYLEMWNKGLHVSNDYLVLDGRNSNGFFHDVAINGETVHIGYGSYDVRLYNVSRMNGIDFTDYGRLEVIYIEDADGNGWHVLGFV